MRHVFTLCCLVVLALSLMGCDQTAQKPTTRPAKAPAANAGPGGEKTPNTAAPPTPATAQTPDTPDTPTAPPAVGGVAAEAPAGQKPRVALVTTMGTFVVELEPAKAPQTVKNFLRYVDEKFYDGTIFHRVIDGFMIQGGGFTKDMTQKKTHEPIQNEAANGLKNTIGAVAMARTSEPHSATAQFFINVANNDALDHPGADGWGYCVFGRVVEGMDVVNAIKKVETQTVDQMKNVPIEPVVIESARRKE